MEEVHEECGIAGVYLKDCSKKSLIVPEALYVMGSRLQHRGQLSAGVAAFNYSNGNYEKRLKLVKEVGLVDDLFRVREDDKRKEFLDYLIGIAGIIHTRYATAGSSSKAFEMREEAQPFMRHHPRPWKSFVTAFNGNLANYNDLRTDMLEEGYVLDTTVDTEIITYLTAFYLKQLSGTDARERDAKPDPLNVQKAVMQRLDGAYNTLTLFADGDLVAVRDPLGFKPLVWGENSDFYAIASESIALKALGIDKFHPVNPGNCIIFNQNGMKESSIISMARKALCHFEIVYFSKPGSVIDNQSVIASRRNFGKKLAEKEPLKHKFPGNYLVAGVPNTATAAAEAFAEALDLPCVTAITKGQGKRGFINKSGERIRIMSNEYDVLDELVRGKNLIIVEDSIVRGETIKKQIKMAREAGAKEVHVRSTEPPIYNPCFYGIDFADYHELIAWRNRNAENLEKAVAREIGADSVVFQSIEGLVEASGFKKDELCLACLNGDYPTPCGKKLAEMKLRNLNLEPNKP